MKIFQGEGKQFVDLNVQPSALAPNEAARAQLARFKVSDVLGGAVPGLSVVKTEGNLPPGDCFTAAFGFKRLQEVLRSQPSDFVPGAVIFYVDHFREGHRITHAGRVGDNAVVSRWGGGALFEHPRDLVPPSYGDSFFCLRVDDE